MEKGQMNREFFKKHYKQLSQLLDCINVGVYITDRNGMTLLLNDESCKTGGLTREEVLGKTMEELIVQGFIEDSVTLKTLKSKNTENIIQSLGDGGKIFVTGMPLFLDGEIELVVCTERDITETLSLKALIEEQDETTEKYRKEIEYLKMKNIEMWGDLIAEEEASKRVADNALRIAKRDTTTVLLTGETGTGKEVYANFIYQNSPRVGKPFIKVNCAAIPENLLESEMFGYVSGAFTGADKNGKIGLFEMANHGTIFLDEIGELPVYLQSKLLRVLQEKEIMRIGGTKTIALDIRVIAATNKNLEEEIKRGNFRQDLYYRLNIMPVELLPLRGRQKDIAALTNFFIDHFNRGYNIKKYIADDALEVLKAYDWPGNIRELENIIERLMISFDGNKITKFQIQTVIGLGMSAVRYSEDVVGKSFDELVDDYEKNILEEMLRIYKKPSIVATQLKMHKSTLSRKMRKYNL